MGILGLTLVAWYRLPAGFWLDETVTAWIVSGNFYTTLARALHFQKWSPLYFLLLHGWAKVFGLSEIALRSFSLCAVIIGCVFFFLILQRRFRPELAAFGTIFPCAVLFTYVTRLDARPYCLAIAFSMAAYYYFFLWLDSNDIKDRVLLIVFIVATIYTHWLYGTILIVQTLLLFILKISNRRVYIRQWIINLFIIGVLCSPNILNFIQVYHERFTFNYLPPPDLKALMYIMFPLGPTFLLFTVSCLTLIIYLLFKEKLNLLNNYSDMLIMGILWLVVPAFILFVSFFIFNVSVLSFRYNGISYAGIGVIITSFFACMPRTLIRNILISIISAFIVFSVSTTAIQNNDYFSWSWREPTAFLVRLERETPRPVLFSSGLIESSSKEWITDPSTRDYLLAPIQYYQPGLDAVPIPGVESIPLLDDILKNEYKPDYLKKNGFYLLVQDSRIACYIFVKYFSDRGFTMSLGKRFSGISVFEFKYQKS